MMSLLSPLAFALGVLAAVSITALHFLTTRRPPVASLPTARFVPITSMRAVSRSSRPTDLLLLALRVLAVLLIGAAFAGPVLDSPGPLVRSVVLLDVSSGVADPGAAAARARESVTEGGAMILFDDSAREWSVDPLDESSVRIEGASASPRGELSPALVLARRVGARIARGADSIRLVIVSPLSLGSIDAFTAAARAEWPGGIELIRPAAIADTVPSSPVRLVTTLADDPIAPALDRLPANRGAHSVRIVRRFPDSSDSAWTNEPSRVLVVWPLVSTEIVAPDALAGFGARTATLVAPFARLDIPSGSRVLARWSDGAPAVTESPLGQSCVRWVGVGLPLAGDLTLRAPFVEFLEVLVEPCGGAREVALADSTLGWLRGDGSSAVASQLMEVAGSDARLVSILLAIAIGLLVVEWILRRREQA